MPKIAKNTCTNSRRSTSHRSRAASSDAERRPSSEDDTATDSDDGGEDRLGHRSWSSSENVSEDRGDENVSWQHRDAVSDNPWTTTGTYNSDVKKVAVTRRRTEALLNASGLCLSIVS